MKLLISISLLFIVIQLPNLSFGLKCWRCGRISTISSAGRQNDPCSEPLSLRERNCNHVGDMCLHVEYLINNNPHYVGCEDYSYHSFKEELYCTTTSLTIKGQSVYARQCTCATDFCNNPNKERIQCFSCYGNRKGINGDEPFDNTNAVNTAVTDFVCQVGEVPEAIKCPLDAQVCMIEWNNQHKTIGCSSHQIPVGQTSYGYYLNGVGEGYCNTNRCNIDTLKDLLPEREPTTTTTTKRTTKRTIESNSPNSGVEEPIENGNTEEEESSGPGNTEEDKSSSAASSLLIIIIIVVVLVLIMALCIFAAILILRRKNNPNRAVMPFIENTIPLNTSK